MVLATACNACPKKSIFFASALDLEPGSVPGVVDFHRPALTKTILAIAKGSLSWSLFAIFYL